jgi:cell wall-associated NlpC family hydrolase
MSNYAIAKIPTPVYNKEGGLEFIAFPGTKFALLNETQVLTNEYPTKQSLYVDLQFLEKTSSDTPERKKKLPSATTILKFMESLIGTPYLWGGNWAQGLPQAPNLCKGVDCSGLLYQATNGFTPRNTSELVHYGEEVFTKKPLDMIVWKGHVIFILNEDQTIESLSGKGVIISSFKDRYAEVCEKLRAESKPFYLRRWHPDFLP